MQVRQPQQDGEKDDDEANALYQNAQFLTLQLSELRDLLERNLFPGLQVSVLTKVKKLDPHRRRSSQDNHVLCVATKKGKRPRLQRVTFENGLYTVTQTWRLRDVKQVEIFDQGSVPGFSLFLEKNYYYGSHTLKERNEFLLQLLLTFQSSYDGRLPQTSIDMVELRLASAASEEQAMADIAQSYRQLMSNSEEESLERLLKHAVSLGGVPDFAQLARDLDEQQSQLSWSSTHALIGAESQLEEVCRSLEGMATQVQQTSLWLNTYDAQLTFMRRYIGHVEARNALLHTHQTNQRRMATTLDRIVGELTLEPSHLATLSSGSLRCSSEGLSHMLEAADALQTALSSPTATSAELGQLRAVREQVSELESLRETFASRLLRHLVRVFEQLQRVARDGSLPLPTAGLDLSARRSSYTTASDGGGEHGSGASSGNTGVGPDSVALRRLVHEEVFEQLQTYGPLIRWLGQANYRLHRRLRRAYRSSMQRRYTWEVKQFFRGLQGCVVKSGKLKGGAEPHPIWSERDRGLLAERVDAEQAFSFAMRAIALSMLSEQHYWESVFALPSRPAGSASPRSAMSAVREHRQHSSEDSLQVSQGTSSRTRSRSRSPRATALEQQYSSSDDDGDYEAGAVSAQALHAHAHAEAHDSAAELSQELAEWLAECFRDAEGGLRTLLDATAKQDPLSLVSALADSVPYLESGLRPLLALTALLQQRAKQLVNAHLDVYAGQLAQLPTPLKRAGLLTPVRSLPALLDRMASKADRHQHGQEVLRTAYQKLALAALSSLARLFTVASSSLPPGAPTASSTSDLSNTTTATATTTTATATTATATATASSSISSTSSTSSISSTSSTSSSSTRANTSSRQEAALAAAAGVAGSDGGLSKEEELACVVVLENYHYLAQQLQNRSNPALLEFLAAAQQGYERALQRWSWHLAREIAPTAWAFFAVIAELVPRLRRPADVSFHEVASGEALARRVLQPLQKAALFRQLARLAKRTRKLLTMPELLLEPVWGQLTEKLCAQYLTWSQYVAQCYPNCSLEVSTAELRQELQRLLRLQYEKLSKKKHKESKSQASSSLSSSLSSSSLKSGTLAEDDTVDVEPDLCIARADSDDDDDENDDDDDDDDDEPELVQTGSDGKSHASSGGKRSKLRRLARRKSKKHKQPSEPSAEEATGGKDDEKQRKMRDRKAEELKRKELKELEEKERKTRKEQERREKEERKEKKNRERKAKGK